MIASKFGLVHYARLAALVVIVVFAGGCAEKVESPDKLLADAKQEIKQGNPGAAIIHLKNLLQISPENGEARYLIGTSYNEVGDYKAAESQLRRAQELRYNPIQVGSALGKALLLSGEYKKLLDEIRVDEGARDDLQAEVLTLRGLALLGLGRSSEAREPFEQALAKQAEFAEALIGLAKLAAAEKKLDEALQFAQRAVASAPRNVEAWLVKGDLARAKADVETARSSYAKALEIKPSHIPARLSMASLDIATNNLEEARKHVEEVRKAAPSNALANYTQALIEVREDKYPAARDAILQALRAAPNHLPSLLAAGVIESALGAHDQAQAYLRRVLERAPRHLHARLLLVSSLMKGGQVPAAVEALQPALSQAPADPNVLALAGAVSMRNNEFAKAAQYFDKAAKLDPKNVETRAQLGISRLAAGDADHGLAELESAVKLNPDKPQADIVLVISHLQRKNYDQALKAVQGLEKKEPTNPLTYNLKAAIYMGKKDTANARKQLEHALELQPDFMPAVMNLAQLDLEDKNPISARARFEKVLEKDPKNPHALLGLAVAAPHLGATPAEQIAWLERARDASPTAIQPKLMLARAYAQTGDMKNALEIAQQTATANPDNVDAVDMLGVLQMNAGQKEQAVTTYSRLAALHPKSPVVLYRLAGAQGAGNDQAAAAATLKKALALKPDYGAAQVALVELYTRTQKYPEALALAKQIQKQETKSPAGHVLEGDVLMEQKKFAEAAKAYDSAYALGRTTEVAVKSHLAYVQSGKADEGDARLARWLKESPDDAIARQLAGDSALSRGKIKDAIGHYELIVQKQPDNAAVLNNLAVAYQQVKDPRALATGERAYKLKPDSAAVMDTLGWMLVEQGNLARGVELLRSAVTAAPNAAEVRYHLAQGLLKSGDKANARTELERIASSKASFPQHAEALALLKELQGKP